MFQRCLLVSGFGLLRQGCRYYAPSRSSFGCHTGCMGIMAKVWYVDVDGYLTGLYFIFYFQVFAGWYGEVGMYVNVGLCVNVSLYVNVY